MSNQGNEDDLNEQIHRIMNSKQLAPDTEEHPLQPGMTRVIHIRVSTYDVPKGEEDNAIAADLEEQDPRESIAATSKPGRRSARRRWQTRNLTPWVMAVLGLSTFLLGAVTILSLLMLTLTAHLLR